MVPNEITTDSESDWYADVMLAREEALAREFGPTDPWDAVTPSQDEGWQTTIPGFAFLRFPPFGTRPYWLYLTHGLSQPQSSEELQELGGDEPTGFGEFAMATLCCETWPFKMLETVSKYAVSGSRPVLPLDRLPASDLMDEDLGGCLLAMESPGYKTAVRTRYGALEVLHLVGVTALEVAHARRYPGAAGSKVLECALKHYGIGCITDRTRSSIARRADFVASWRNCGGGTEPTPPTEPRKPFWKR